MILLKTIIVIPYLVFLALTISVMMLFWYAMRFWGWLMEEDKR